MNKKGLIKEVSKKIAFFILCGFVLLIFMLFAVGSWEQGRYAQSILATITGVLVVYRKSDVERIFQVKKWVVVSVLIVGCVAITLWS